MKESWLGYNLKIHDFKHRTAYPPIMPRKKSTFVIIEKKILAVLILHGKMHPSNIPQPTSG